MKQRRETVIRFSTGADLEIEKMDDLDYRAVSPVIMKEMSSRQRFVRFEERLDTSDMSSDMMLKIAHGKIDVHTPTLRENQS